MKALVLLALGTLTQLFAAELTPSQVYKVSEINGEKLQGVTVPTMMLDNQSMRVQGQTGVNSYSGNYVLKDGALVISNTIMSLRAAADQSRNKTETLFKSIISAPLEIKKTETGLLLSNTNGSLLLITEEKKGKK